MVKISRISALLALCFIVVFLPAREMRLKPAQASERPNIILILTDDLNNTTYSHMPRLKSLIIDQGTTFENNFVTYPTCCPSRTTILRGQYPHNHQVLGNEPPDGGYGRFQELGLENSTIATWLHDANYKTVLMGKYLNGYSGTHVPPGWDKWYGVVKTGYFNFDLNENGHIVSYTGENNYETDVLRHKANTFIQHSSKGSRPFFMYIATRAPHGPATPAPRHENLFNDAKAPRPPSFNEKDVSDKPAHLQRPLLDSDQISYIDNLYRNQLRSMMAVDEMIGRLVRTLRDNGELNNTYIIFTSDNGFHMGQHRFTPGKRRPYEEDARVPLIVRGPGVPAGKTLDHIVLNNDLAPTFAELGGANAPDFIDGRSLVPLLGSNPPTSDDWRSSFLIESWLGDSYYKALRTRNRLYVAYSNGSHELYNLNNDPYELHNRYESADPQLIKKLQSKLDALRDCAEATCRVAEDK